MKRYSAEQMESLRASLYALSVFELDVFDLAAFATALNVLRRTDEIVKQGDDRSAVAFGILDSMSRFEMINAEAARTTRQLVGLLLKEGK